MAFTKTPTISTHKVVRLPVDFSQSPLSSAFHAKGPKYVNCGPMKISQYGTDPERVIVPRQAFYPIQDLPNTDAFRGMGSYNLAGNPASIFGVSIVALGNNVFIDADPNFASPTDVGNLQYSAGYVGFTQYVIGDNNFVFMLETHPTAAYLHKLDTATNTFTSYNLGFGAAGDPVFLDGYLFISSFPYAAGDPIQRIYNSSISDPTSFTPSTDYLDAEMSPDILHYIAKHKNHLVAFSAGSIEFFYNGANQLGSPLTRSASYSVQLGSLLTIDETSANYYRPPYCYVGDDLYFIGRAPSGMYGVYVISDFQVKKVSDRFLDRLMNPKNNTLYGIPTSGRLFPVPNRGQTHVVLQWSRYSNGSTIGSEYGVGANYATHYAFNPQENEWSKWVLGDGYSTISSSFSDTNSYFIQGVNLLTLNPQYFIKQITFAGTPTVKVFSSYYSEDDDDHAFGTVYSEVLFDLNDFGNQQYKHIKYVDILGDFHPNTLVTLQYTTGNNMATYNNTTTMSGDTYGPRRVRNITRSRNIGFKVKFASQEPYIFRGMDVSYNLGSV